MSEGKYAGKAEDWTGRQYADARSYLEHRAELVSSLGPPLEPGDEVLDLACGDGGLGELLVARGLRYRGVDVTPEMVEEARKRLGSRAAFDLGDLDDYVPPERVAATTVFRAIYYATDRRAFFRHVAGFTDKKLVFDLNPRQYRVEAVIEDLRVAGLRRAWRCARSSSRRPSRSRDRWSRWRRASSAQARLRAWRSTSGSPTSLRRLALAAKSSDPER